MPPVEAYYDMLLAGQNLKADTAVEPALSVAPDAGDRPQSVEIRVRENTPEGMCFQWHSNARTTVGKQRQTNEDAFLERPEIGLWVVADGMGGYSKGDVASHAVVDMLNTLSGSGNLETLAAATIECLKKVNADLIEKAASFGPEETIGTTVVVMLAAGKRCTAIWVGDSRLYRYSGGELKQLTRDHTPETGVPHQGESVDETFVDGQMENIVTRAVGGEPELLVDAIAFEAKEGDVFLLCSDGLYRELATHDIAAVLGGGNPAKSSQRLIDLALERGARDNVTAVVLKAEGHI
jgi:type VI secretion system protein ImpM